MLATTLLIGAAAAQEIATNGFPKDVSAELESEKTTYQTGEPITLFARLSNTSLVPKMVPAKITPWFGNVKMEVSSKQEGPFSDYMGPGWGVDEGLPGEVVSLKDHIVEDEIVLLMHPGAGGSLLDNVPLFPFMKGQYWLRAKIFNKGFTDSVTTNVVEVKVEDPIDPESVEFANQIATNVELAEFIQIGGTNAPQEVIDRATLFARRQPRTPLGLVAASAVAKSYETRDPERALEMVRLVLADPSAPSSVRNSAQLLGVTILNKHGTEPELRGILDTALAEPKRVAYKRNWDAVKRQIDQN